MKQPTTNRACTNCTACCEGWLGGEAYGKRFQSGCPCHFKCETGCSIYDSRPFTCKSFNCEWLLNKDLPEWMKPNLSGVIVVEKNWGSKQDQIYYEVLELGKKLDSVVLNWFFSWHEQTNVCLRIMVDGGWYHYGSKEFKNCFE